jgi:hypothetical protein
MRTRRSRLRLSTAALAVIALVAASTTGHLVLNKGSSGPSLDFIGKQVAKVGASAGKVSSSGNGGAASATPVPMGGDYGALPEDGTNFLSLGGFAQGTANWEAVIASTESDLMAQYDAPGAGFGGPIDGMELAMADTDAFGGQGGGSATGGGAGGGETPAGFGDDAPIRFVEGSSGGLGGGAGGDAGGSGGSSGGSRGVPGNGSADVPSVAAPVPEPSTYLMMLGGLAAVGTLLRRRREMIR